MSEETFTPQMRPRNSQTSSLSSLSVEKVLKLHDRKKNETHETVLARARRSAPLEQFPMFVLPLEDLVLMRPGEHMSGHEDMKHKLVRWKPGEQLYSVHFSLSLSFSLLPASTLTIHATPTT